jgi:hypothetical protein
MTIFQEAREAVVDFPAHSGKHDQRATEALIPRPRGEAA